MSSAGPLDHRKLYRLPWSLTDNIISWLEPTKQCNIYCDGCYSANTPSSHKSLDTVRQDLDTFERYRQTDAVSIAGGDPLIHPQIVEIVRMVSARGLKPIVNTNGVALTPELLRDLKKAGLRGFTFHIDSLQRRPGWMGRNEIELNELRLKYAEMAASVGGLSCAFNATIYEKTLGHVPDLLLWAQKHMDIVHVMVFINFRAAIQDGRYDYLIDGRKIDVKPLVYTKAAPQRSDLSANEVVEEIRKVYPDFQPCAYLNGTEKPDSFKWLLTLRVGDHRGIVGYAGAKFCEVSQVLNHLLHGRYLGYIQPNEHRRARWMAALGGLFDPGLRRAFRRDLGALLTDPLRLFRPLHLQSVMIIQPVDVMADGRQSMCDSCPDITVHQGELVWSCRLEERLKFGRLMQLVPAEHAAVPAEKETVEVEP